MPLQHPQVPADVWSTALDFRAARRAWVPKRLWPARFAPEFEWPHEIFVIARFSEGVPLEGQARAVGWRFIELSRSEPEAVEVSEYERRQVVEVERGPEVTDSVLAFENARQQLAGTDAPFFPRLLRAPALHVTAAWLHTERISDDLLLPLDTPHEELEPLRPMSLETFAETLASIDRAMRAAYADGPPAGEDVGG